MSGWKRRNKKNTQKKWSVKSEKTRENYVLMSSEGTTAHRRARSALSVKLLRPQGEEYTENDSGMATRGLLVTKSCLGLDQERMGNKEAALKGSFATEERNGVLAGKKSWD